MQPTSIAFKDNAAKALADPDLRQALKRVATNFTGRRADAKARLPEFDALRDEAIAIKTHTLANLDHYLAKFEENVRAQGGQVHFCATPRAACETILALCRQVDAKSVTKGKSMIAEEIALNKFLEKNGIEPVETDLGEYIIQLADEPPSHIIGPAVHKTKRQIAELFHEHHQKFGKDKLLTEGPDMVAEAREVLRRRYVEADAGITGANFLIAETGSTVIVTNEGNGDLTQTLPKMHIVISAIDKVVPTLEDASTILRVLARSATGQEFSVYTTFSTGPRRAADLDGPPAFHVVLLDNGRSDMLGTELQPLLRCIRCGACMNHCPVYQSVGGHAYGWVYPGPIGAALDPHFIGIEEAQHLPNASTFCGKCQEVCPMRIPLPEIMRHWREKAFTEQVTPPVQRLALKVWAFVAQRPTLYGLANRIGARLLKAMAKHGKITRLPLASGWTDGRDFPAPQGKSFQELWSERGGARE